MIAAIPSAVLIGVDGHQVSVEVHVSNGLPGFTVVGSARCRRPGVPRPGAGRSAFQWAALADAPGHRQPGAVRDAEERCRTRPPDRHRRAGGVGGAGARGGRHRRHLSGSSASMDRSVGCRGPWCWPSRSVDLPLVVADESAREASLAGGCEVRTSPTLRDLVDRLSGRSAWQAASEREPSRGRRPGAGGPSFRAPTTETAPDRRAGLPVDRSVRCPGATAGPARPGGGRRRRPPSVDGRTTRLGQDHVGHPAPWPPSPSRSVHGPRDHPGPLGGRTPAAPHRLGLAPSVSGAPPRDVAGGHDRWWNRLDAAGRDQHVPWRRVFLDELGEFPTVVLDALRQPLEEGQVRVSRARGSTDLPRPVHPGGFHESLSLWRRRCAWRLPLQRRGPGALCPTPVRALVGQVRYRHLGRPAAGRRTDQRPTGRDDGDRLRPGCPVPAGGPPTVVSPSTPSSRDHRSMRWPR